MTFDLMLVQVEDEGNAALDNVKDIIIENFTITAHKKELFKNATLKIMHGHRYGLLGPNGQGEFESNADSIAV